MVVPVFRQGGIIKSANISTIKKNTAGCRSENPADNRKQCGLAGSGVPDNRNKITLINLESDILDTRKCLIPNIIGFGKI